MLGCPLILGNATVSACSSISLDQLRLTTIKQIQNTRFVAAKLVIGDEVLYAIKGDQHFSFTRKLGSFF